MKTLGKTCVALAVLVFLGYTVGGFVGVPYFAKKTIIEKVKEQSPKAEVSVGSVSFNPFSLAVSLEGLKIKNFALDEAAIDFAVKSVSTGVDTFSISDRSVAIAPVLIAKPQVTYIKDLSKKTSSPRKIQTKEKAKTESKEANAWKWSVASISITDGQVLLKDTGFRQPKTIGLTALNVDVKTITSDLGKTPFTVKAKALNGTLDANGTFAAKDEDASINATVKAANLSLASPWVERASNSALKSGSLDFSISGNYKKGSAKGTANALLSNLSVEKSAKKIFGAESIRVTSAKLTALDPLSFTISRIEADLGIRKATGINKNVTNLIGDLVSAFGNKKTGEKIKTTDIDHVSVSGVVYKNGKLTSNAKGASYELIRQLNALLGK